MNVLLLSRYTSLGASSRYRSYQYLPYLRERGFQVTVAPLLSDRYLQHLYGGKGMPVLDVARSFARRISDLLGGRFDLLWIEYEALPWIPSALERLLIGRTVPYVVDYDDAVFHRYDMHRLGLVRSLLGRKIDRVMARSALVIAGNRYLADRARQAGARRIEILPTVVDLGKYPIRQEPDNEIFTIGWIGSPSTERYIALAREPLAALCRGGKAQVVAVGARNVALDDFPVQMKSWSESDEPEEIAKFDVGIMPLADSPWERGKCGHKLIKYMASSRPVVASPVGVNREIVQDGVNGFLASNTDQWVRALSLLREDRSVAYQMGREGRRIVEQRYCMAVTAPVLADLLREASQNP